MNTPTELGTVLLRIARGAIGARFGLGGEPAPAHEALARPGATFVTLRCDEELRGCIGSVVAHRALALDVHANAVAAAFADPRFPPLSRAEYAAVAIEVSLLSPSEALPSSAEEADALGRLQPHDDGVILEFGRHRSTFLPQVWEQLPDPREFMAALKRKAGLPGDFWSSEIRLARYRVEKFLERAPEAAR
jgi:hypothetical protein